jgi:hypothetical protein
MNRDIYEGVDSEGTGGDGVRRREHKPVCHCPFDPFRCAWERTTRTMTSAFAYVSMLTRVLGLLLAALALTACGAGNAPPVTIPKPVIDAAACAACSFIQDAGTRAECQAMACPSTPTPEPRPRPQETATVASTATATPNIPPAPTEAPTVAATPVPRSTPNGPSWTTRLLWHNGFGACNPYPCDPTTAACAAIVDLDGNGVSHRRYPVRSDCAGDRTAWFVMPGFDIVAQGEGCYSEERMQPCRPSCTGPACAAECQKCLHEDALSPCGHAPSCDDHVSCYRNFIGCGCNVLGTDKCTHWDADSPQPGSILRVTGAGMSCTDVDGYAFKCFGPPGTQYSICTEPYPGAKTADGRSIPGGQKLCASGWF